MSLYSGNSSTSAAPAYGEPIAAPVTPPGIGGVAIVRLSGKGVFVIGAGLLPPKRRMNLGKQREFFYTVLRDPVSKERIDEAVILCFPAPRSYTGEDVMEFQLHGGRISSSKLLDVLLSLGARMAEPGEFTRRAFLNGRLDLSQAEAVMDLVSAQSERAQQMALEQLQGSLRNRLELIYDDLVAVCADLEASLDFAEEEIPDDLSFVSVGERIAQINRKLQEMLTTWHEGQLLREGTHVAISGRPNAGKSVLFNALLGRARAIVAETPGTTRDTIEETLLLEGIPLRLVDTAGLRETVCEVERQGVARTEDTVRQAQFHLRVVDAGEPWEETDLEALQRLPPERTLVVLNKLDKYGRPEITLPEAFQVIHISALTGEGFPELKKALLDCLGVAESTEGRIAVNSRHREALSAALESLRSAFELCEIEDAVLVAQALRETADSLGAITGRNVGEDVLDHIFSKFCIGK